MFHLKSRQEYADVECVPEELNDFDENGTKSPYSVHRASLVEHISYAVSSAYKILLRPRLTPSITSLVNSNVLILSYWPADN